MAGQRSNTGRGSKQQSALQTLRAAVLSGLMLALTWAMTSMQSEAKPSARILPTGEGIELTDSNGTSYKVTLPLYRSGDIRYFSAGVGIEEREAEYPSFPLKLVFVAGVKPYLSYVSVIIEETSGPVRLEVPPEQVAGPWLFVDLPSGTYTITASKDGHTQVREGVSVRAGDMRTVYFHWPEGIAF
ncbi:MAG: carboxypeptidase-like regulatory domain-containing protein [Nitrospiraceae bacterium]